MSPTVYARVCFAEFYFRLRAIVFVLEARYSKTNVMPIA